VAIVGAHVLLYTREAERLRETLRDGLGWIPSRATTHRWLADL